MNASKVLFVALLFAIGLGITLRPSTAVAEDPIATVIITYANSSYDLGYVYPSTPVTDGWAHIVVGGVDAYVGVGANPDKSKLPPSPPQALTCS